MFRNLKSSLLNVLFWSVISAAFIGPGTLTTAAAAGATYQLQLLWTLLFAVVTCLVFQEMASRITICSGKDINEIIRQRGKSIFVFVGSSVVLGCAAYEAGNILGAVSGIELIVPLDRSLLTIALGSLAFLVLYFNSVRMLSRFLGCLVALMGIVFILVASQTDFTFGQLVSGLTVPEVPRGSEWLILGLVGTTVVPYNLFLGSGISKDQELSTMRVGLTISVVLGGIISMAILVAGTNITSFDDFSVFTVALGGILGPWAKYLLAIGLFAAGLTSAITAPLAAAFIGKSLLGSVQSFRIFWMMVLLIGILFGVFAYKPLPVIIAAQALNGLILPVVAILLILYANDRQLLANRVNGVFFNVLSLLLLNVLVLIGINNIYKALSGPIGYVVSDDAIRYVYMELMALPVIAVVIYKINLLRYASA